MKSLHVHLARRANAEDDCTVKFWEGRFRSQALLDEAGLLTAMAYVDLNPVRAGIAATPEEAELTSIYARVRAIKVKDARPTSTAHAAVPLRRFASGAQDSPAMPYTLKDYLELFDWTGLCVRSDKRGFINDGLPAIAQRLSIDGEARKAAMRPRGNLFGRAMGTLDHLRLHAKTLGQCWVRGLANARKIYA